MCIRDSFVRWTDGYFVYSSSTIYALSEDFQTYKEVYDVDDYEICNLFAIDDTLYAEIRKEMCIRDRSGCVLNTEEG